MEYGRKYTLKHEHFGEIATFERLPEEGGLRFRCTAQNWYPNVLYTHTADMIAARVLGV